MLKKLLKHDFISIWRLASPVYAITVGIVLFAYVMRSIAFESPVMSFFTTFLFPAALIALIIACVLVFALPILHFYRNLMTGEGYLSFTLPVTTYQLVLSKLIAGSATMLFNLAFAFGGILLLVSTQMDLSTLQLTALNLPNGCTASSVIALIAITAITANICQLAYFYLAICLGQSFGKNKIIGSALGYVIIYAVNQLFNLVLLCVMFLCIGFDRIDTFMEGARGFYTLFGIVIAEYVVLGTISYFLSGRILKKRLNLN